MGTLCQLLALPGCFLVIGLLRGDCRSLVLSFIRRVFRLTGADNSARAELLRRSSPGMAGGVVEDNGRRTALARGRGAKKHAIAPPDTVPRARRYVSAAGSGGWFPASAGLLCGPRARVARCCAPRQ
jgi:hypothetical protein